MAFGYLTPYRRGGTVARGGGTGSLFDLHRQMNSLFDELFTDDVGTRGIGGPLAGWPALDLDQDDDKIEICAELPGVARDDIELNVEDGMLVLTGEKRSEREDKQGGYSERSYGRFERRIALPSNVDEDGASADFENGVLKITIPKAAEKSRGRRIPLGRGRSQSISDNESSLIEDDSKAGKQAHSSRENAKSKKTREDA